MAPAPYDFASLRTGGPDPAVRWPLPQAEVRALNAVVQRELVAAVRDLPTGDARLLLTIAAPAMGVTLLTVLTAWLTVVRARERDLDFTYGRPSLMEPMAKGEAPDAGIFFKLVRDRFAAAITPRRDSRLRALARSYLANRRLAPWGPRVALLNRNHLMDIETARTRDHRFRFLVLDALFRGDAPAADATLLHPAREAAATLVARLAAHLDGRGCPVPDVVAEALRRAIDEHLEAVSRHDALLRRNWRRVPQDLWTGTGGNYIARLCRAAVRREGGRITGFDHGGNSQIHMDLAPLHTHELSLCDRFVTDTPEKAALLGRGVDPALSLDGRPPEVVAAARGGVPVLQGAGQRPIRTVMYVTTAFVGETQYPLQPLIPDPVYADWQGRLVDALHAAGVRVLVKQHPEGLRRGEPLVMSANGTYIGGRFGEVAHQADAFILDYPATSTLWEAITSDKPVIFADLGLADWNPEVRADFERRCAIVSCPSDEWNRPRIDTDALAAALAAPPDDGGAYARKYLTGG